MRRTTTVLIAMALVAAACSGGATELSASEYGDRLESIASHFREQVAGAGFELLDATAVFAAYEDAYDEVAALQPPDDLAALHDDFVTAFAETQRVAAEYLANESITGTFSVTDLQTDEMLQQAAKRMLAACNQLRIAAGEARGAPLRGGCQY